VIIFAICDVCYINRPQHCSSTTFIYISGHSYQSFVKLIVFNSCLFSFFFFFLFAKDQVVALKCSKFPKIYIILIYIYTVCVYYTAMAYWIKPDFCSLIFGNMNNIAILDNSNLMRIYFLVLSTKPQLIARNRLLHYSIILAFSASNPL